MKILIVVVIGGILASCQTRPCRDLSMNVERAPQTENSAWPQVEALTISRTAFDGSVMPFEPHTNYVSMPLPFAPMREFFDDLQKRTPKKLITRGEAHVTVLTPPEFDWLKGKLSIDEISAIAIDHGVQSSKLVPVCLGIGRAPIAAQEEQTFFIVVEAENLFKIRRAIAREFAVRGGDARAFNPDRYFPHITVGFTKTDLHEASGVIKDKRACLSPLKSKD